MVPVSTKSTTASANPSPHAHFLVQRIEELLRQRGEARDDSLPRESFDVGDLARDGCLDAEATLSEPEIHDPFHLELVLLDHVDARYADVDVALADVLGYVGGREEDHGHVEILAYGDIESGFAVVFDAGALEHGRDLLVEATLLGDAEEAVVGIVGGHGSFLIRCCCSDILICWCGNGAAMRAADDDDSVSKMARNIAGVDWGW